MPTLHWIGKDKVINHHRDVPYKVLEHQYTFRANVENTGPGAYRDEPNGKVPKAGLEPAPSVAHTGNMIIQGDNLEALKSLLPKYEGKVKCIYIDPPYNTGNEGWVYNDNVNDPRIKKWLGDVVGKEGEDLSRHDKWLCMMYPRLVLLHKLLAEDGVIFVSIDDNEQASLRLMLDEVFGSNRFVGKAVWFKKRKGSYLSKKFVSLTEYVYIYSKATDVKLLGGVPDSSESQPIVKRTNSVSELNFPGGLVKTKLKDVSLEPGRYGKGSSAVELLETVQVFEGVFVNSFTLKAPFTWSQAFLDEELTLGTSVVINTMSLQPRVFRDAENKHKGFPSYIDGRTFSATTDDAYEELNRIFGKERAFDYSKPHQLVSYLLHSVIHNDRDAIVLDSFGGSGTTAQAVLNLNRHDAGARKFILIEMMDYAETLTAERVKRVMGGFGPESSKTAGTGGAFDYYTLGEPLFDAQHNLNEAVGVEKIREYIWYSETRQPLGIGETPGQARSDASTPLGAGNTYYLGTHEATAYYFVYEKEELTTLDHELLATLPTKGERTMIYADNCLLPKKFMEQHGIVFKKIPRDITRF